MIMAGRENAAVEYNSNLILAHLFLFPIPFFSKHWQVKKGLNPCRLVQIIFHVSEIISKHHVRIHKTGSVLFFFYIPF